MSQPAVAILLPVSNEACLLPAAPNSLLRQSLKVRELVASDDGSTDQSGCCGSATKLPCLSC